MVVPAEMAIQMGKPSVIGAFRGTSFMDKPTYYDFISPASDIPVIKQIPVTRPPKESPRSFLKQCIV